MYNVSIIMFHFFVVLVSKNESYSYTSIIIIPSRMLEFSRNIIRFPEFKQLNEYLSQHSIPSTYINPLTAKYYVEHTNVPEYGEYIRIHELNRDGWFGTNLFGTKRYVGGVDLCPRPKDDTMEITYSAVNDGEYAEIMKTVPLLPTESVEVFNGLINYSKLVANKHNMKKLEVDVHQSLRLYNKYYKQVGFMLTDQRSSDNLNWIKTVLKL